MNVIMKLRFNLFWKIFLWLWLTLILFIAVHFVLTGYAQNDIRIEPIPDNVLPVLKRVMERLIKVRLSVGQNGQQPAMFDRRFDMHLKIGPMDTQPLPPPPPVLFFKNKPDDETLRGPVPPEFILHDDGGSVLPPPPGMRFPDKEELFILDKKGNEIDGKSLDHTLVLLHNQYLTDEHPRIAYKQRNLFAGPFIIKQGNQIRYVYSHRQLSNLGEERLKIIWSQAPKHLLLSAVLITFPLCFALAWYLSAPIHRLQQATHEFSSTQKVPEQITPLLKRGDEFGDLARDFKRMASQIQDALENQKRLLSDVSHELRSPLARLRIALGLVEQGTAKKHDNTYQREIDQMVLECERIDSLIEQLLDIARLDSAQLNIQRREFDFCSFLLEIKKDTELEAEEKQLTLRDVMLPDQVVNVNGVSVLLHSAVENILRNAVYHAPVGSEIEICLSTDENSLLLTIADHGPGVDEAHLEKIFEPFYRPQYARERDSGGSGLGLAIAKRAIEYHDGCVWAENAESGGLQVNIRLPVQSAV